MAAITNATSIAKPANQSRVIASGIGIFTAGALLFNILPLLLGVTADELRLTPQQLGMLGSAYVLPFALIAVPAVTLLKRVSWRAMGLGAGLVAVTALLVASQIRVYAGLLLLFLITGVAMSLLFAIGNRILGAASDPDRAYGFGYWVMLAVSGLVIFGAAHAVVPTWGYAGLYITAAIVVGILVTGCLALDASGTTSHDTLQRASLTPAILLALLAMVFYFFGVAGVWAFVERIGVSRGIAVGTVGTIVGVGYVVSAFASLVPIVTERRVTRGTMLIAGSLMTCGAMALLSLRAGLHEFWIGALIFLFVWSAATVYISAIIATADRTGRFLPLIGGAMGAGATIGPVLAGGLVRGNDFNYVFIMCAVAVTISAILAVASERKAHSDHLVLSASRATPVNEATGLLKRL